MKKINFILCAFLVLAVFAGCSRPSTKDESGLYHDFEETLKAAKNSGKKVLLVFSKVESGGFNESLVNGVLRSSDYAQVIGKEFETCLIDFSNSKFADKSKKQKEQNERDMRTTVIYGVETPPTVMVLTAEGYVVSVITYLSSKNVSEFSNLIEVERDKITAMDSMVSAIDGAEGLERIKAIDALYENTSTAYRYQLRGLVEEVIRTDSKNQSGLVGKYLFTRAVNEALDCYIDRQPQKAAECYLKPVKSDFLSVEEKQQCYYAAAFITGNETPSAAVSEKILEYLNAAISLGEETRIGQQCKYLAERQQQILERQKAVEEQKSQEENAD